ncbi:hypothetical protein PVAP13_1KG522330 [Panicum virgatum]|uniref:Uncharacterized protein n=1 Tax=Panicum virgatum TaxID=38727 RepID=A0A8T0XKT3_PANVG|nr:hypothetical protein PVAP13_1KG522330 [Panicum virgatum]
MPRLDVMRIYGRVALGVLFCGRGQRENRTEQSTAASPRLPRTGPCIGGHAPTPSASRGLSQVATQPAARGHLELLGFRAPGLARAGAGVGDLPWPGDETGESLLSGAGRGGDRSEGKGRCSPRSDLVR